MSFRWIRSLSSSRFFPTARSERCHRLGNLYNLPTFVDGSLTHEDYIVFEAGTHTEAIKLSYTDYEQIVKPQIADMTVKVHLIQRV